MWHTCGEWTAYRSGANESSRYMAGFMLLSLFSVVFYVLSVFSAFFIFFAMALLVCFYVSFKLCVFHISFKREYMIYGINELYGLATKIIYVDSTMNAKSKKVFTEGECKHISEKRPDCFNHQYEIKLHKPWDTLIKEQRHFISNTRNCFIHHIYPGLYFLTI